MVHLDPSRSAEAVDAGWRAYADAVPGQEVAYRKACEGWQVVAVVSDDVIGALMVRDGVIHLGIVPEWRGRWASRRVIRQMLAYGKRTQMLAGETLEFVNRIKNIEAGFGWEVRTA
jgi:GNAT superfamily N-acetyltransferase